MIQKPVTTWRELLATLIQDPAERQRLAKQLRVNQVTLVRWSTTRTAPRPHKLIGLLDVVPEQQRGLLLELLEAEFGPAFASDSARELPDHRNSLEIDGTFYMRVLRTLATLPAAMSFSGLFDLILEQAIKQLDAQRLGMSIMVSRCLPASDGQVVRSLLESVGRGTPPWNSSLQHEGLLLGIESLTGYAVAVGHLVARQRLEEEDASLIPGYRDRWEESAVAAPITRYGSIAGCLLVSSTQPEYFTHEHEQLIQSYADLLALCFEPHDFSAPGHIRLGVLPPQSVQRTYLAEFQRHLLAIMSQAARDRQPLTVIQAQQRVWQQFEDELLQLTSGPKPLPEHHLSQKELSHDN